MRSVGIFHIWHLWLDLWHKWWCCFTAMQVSPSKQTKQNRVQQTNCQKEDSTLSSHRPPMYYIPASWYLYFRYLRLIKCWCVSWFKGWNKPWYRGIVRDSRLLRLLSCLKCQYIPGYNKFTWGLQISSKMPSHQERSQSLAHILIMYYNSVLWT